MLRWFLELFRGLPDFIQSVLKFSLYCVFVALALGGLNSIPLNYFLKIRLTESDAIALVQSIKMFLYISIPAMGYRQFGFKKMPAMPKNDPDDEEEQV